MSQQSKPIMTPQEYMAALSPEDRKQAEAEANAWSEEVRHELGLRTDDPMASSTGIEWDKFWSNLLPQRRIEPHERTSKGSSATIFHLPHPIRLRGRPCPTMVAAESVGPPKEGRDYLWFGMRNGLTVVVELGLRADERLRETRLLLLGDRNQADLLRRWHGHWATVQLDPIDDESRPELGTEEECAQPQCRHIEWQCHLELVKRNVVSSRAYTRDVGEYLSRTPRTVQLTLAASRRI